MQKLVTTGGLLFCKQYLYIKKYEGMTVEEITRIENEVFTKLVIDTLKQQRAEGKTDFLLDKFEIDRITKERLKKLLAENIK